jgi:hypothetical protein
MYYDFHEWIVMVSMINKQLKRVFIETLLRGSENRCDFNGDLVIPKTSCLIEIFWKSLIRNHDFFMWPTCKSKCRRRRRNCYVCTEYQQWTDKGTARYTQQTTRHSTDNLFPSSVIILLVAMVPNILLSKQIFQFCWDLMKEDARSKIIKFPMLFFINFQNRCWKPFISEQFSIPFLKIFGQGKSLLKWNFIGTRTRFNL